MTTPQLKDLVQEKHTEAENHRFAKYLLSKNVDPAVYADFLYNQYHIYNALEQKALRMGVINGLKDLLRSDRIWADYEELKKEIPDFKEKKYITTIEYERYIGGRPANAIVPHIYVRHFGDMYGGSIMKSKVPGSGTMYDFVGKKNLIDNIRNRLTPEMAEEANKVFGFAIDLFEELANEHNIQEVK
jgi:heme oxygenase